MGNVRSCITGSMRVMVSVYMGIWLDASLTTDPFSSEQVEAGRLPKVVDDWLNEQILAGETVDSIRRKLDMMPHIKEEVSFS